MNSRGWLMNRKDERASGDDSIIKRPTGDRLSVLRGDVCRSSGSIVSSRHLQCGLILSMPDGFCSFLSCLIPPTSLSGSRGWALSDVTRDNTLRRRSRRRRQEMEEEGGGGGPYPSCAAEEVYFGQCLMVSYTSRTLGCEARTCRRSQTPCQNTHGACERQNTSGGIQDGGPLLIRSRLICSLSCFIISTVNTVLSSVK